jgi:Tol biopolymer transport system component
MALAALAAGVWVREAARPVASPLDGARFRPLTNWKGTEEAAEISPDGRFVVFLSDRDGEFDLWRTQVGTGHFKNLTEDIAPLDAPGILRTAGFSGDGSEIWFGGVSQPKMLMPQTGGTPRPFLANDIQTPAWSVDGNRLVYFTQTEQGDPLSIADHTGADARTIEIKGSDETIARDWSGLADTVYHSHNPVWSLDGRWIYFVHGSVREWNPGDEMDIWRVPSAGGSPERLTRLNTAAAFVTVLDARTLLYVAREDDGSGPWLWALDVPSKVSRRVSSGLEQYTSVAASRDGRRVIATRANPTASLWMVPIFDAPAEERSVQPYSVQTAPALAPRFGGKSSLFYLSARGAGDGLWRFNEGKSLEILKGADGPLFQPPAPSPDGRRVALVQKRGGKRRLTIMSADGTNSQTIASSIDTRGAPDWSPDSASIVVGGTDASGEGLFMIPVDGEHRGEPFRLAAVHATSPVWSPDGSIIVYAGKFAKGQVPLFAVRPDGTPVDLPAVHVRPGGYRFARNGMSLVYLPKPESLDFWRLDLITGERRVLTRLAPNGRIRTFDVTPDGKHIVFDRLHENSDVVVIDLPQK